jgi:hypothetical protein
VDLGIDTRLTLFAAALIFLLALTRREARHHQSIREPDGEGARRHAGAHRCGDRRVVIFSGFVAAQI